VAKRQHERKSCLFLVGDVGRPRVPQTLRHRRSCRQPQAQQKRHNKKALSSEHGPTSASEASLGVYRSSGVAATCFCELAGQRHRYSLHVELAGPRDGGIARAAAPRIATHRIARSNIVPSARPGCAARWEDRQCTASSARKWRRGVTRLGDLGPSRSITITPSCTVTHGSSTTRTRVSERPEAAAGRRRHDFTAAHAEPASGVVVCKLC
jgi:hypothetical protein